jgi:hypothetical protein
VRSLSSCALVAIALSMVSQAQDVRVPNSVAAGSEATISVSGTGEATLYLLGPGVARKSQISVGQEIHLPPEDLQHAGRYVVVICSDTCRNASLTVTSAEPAEMVFLVHPSRVPAGQPDAISGVAIPFDQFGNLVVTSLTINFRAGSPKESLFSRAVGSQDGISWFRTNSGKTAGPLQVEASHDALIARRVVQEVASEPCNLRIKGERTQKGIVVETEPVHDCAGNPAVDGTIVTFTASSPRGKSTIDAPIKSGVAQARIVTRDAVVISAASGVAMGNELHMSAKP